MKFTGSLTGNRRDIHTVSPKALLINLEPHEEGFRKHCWIDITPAIEKIQPSGHKKPIQISFEAKIMAYTRLDGSRELTLTELTNIKKIK